MSRADRPVPRRAARPRADRVAAPRVVRLANGLTVLLRQVRDVPLVSVWCWYRVGSKDERPGITGISHWVEHMNFKGTRRISKSEVTRQVDLAGGLWNGYTWLDVTTYLETVRSDALETMLRLEASRMTECTYSAIEVERERTVVISELQGTENDPRSYLERELVGTALQAHPYRWPTIGYLSDLKAITRDDLYRHYRAYYVPNNAVLVIAGDFETGAALRLVRRHFGRIPAGDDPPPVRTVEPPQSGERRVVVRRPSATAYLDVAYHAPAAAEDDFATLLLLDGILAGGPTINIWAGHDGRGPSKSSRLYRALVETDLATEVSTSAIPTRHPHLYRLAATVREGVDPARVEAAILAEIDRLARGDLDDQDLSRSRNQFQARYALESESVTDIAHLLGYFETIGGHRLGLDLPRRVRAVSGDAVVRLARSRLGETRRSVGLLRPAPAEGRPA
jgi:zinc protease